MKGKGRRYAYWLEGATSDNEKANPLAIEALSKEIGEMLEKKPGRCGIASGDLVVDVMLRLYPLQVKVPKEIQVVLQVIQTGPPRIHTAAVIPPPRRKQNWDILLTSVPLKMTIQ